MIRTGDEQQLRVIALGGVARGPFQGLRLRWEAVRQLVCHETRWQNSTTIFIVTEAKPLWNWKQHLIVRIAESFASSLAHDARAPSRWGRRSGFLSDEAPAIVANDLAAMAIQSRPAE